jgi:hypothetical protein
MAMTMPVQGAQDPTSTAGSSEAAAVPQTPLPVEPVQPQSAGQPAIVPPVAAQPDAAPAGAFSQKVLEAIGTPQEGKALVVFFRPSKFIGAAIGFIVREGTVELGKLRSGNYFTASVEPGKHTYVVHSEAKDLTDIEVEAGETYFLSGSVTLGFVAGRPNLSPSDAAAFEAALPKLKKSAPLKTPEPVPGT